MLEHLRVTVGTNFIRILPKDSLTTVDVCIWLQADEADELAAELIKAAADWRYDQEQIEGLKNANPTQ